MQNQTCCSASSEGREKRDGSLQTETGFAPKRKLMPIQTSRSCCSTANSTGAGIAQKSCGCGSQTIKPEKWISGSVSTPVGDVPRVLTSLSAADIFGVWKCRWGIGRMNYAITPGLYCVGNPDAQSPVLVTANYKLTFDQFRKELAGLDAWIVVLDSDGINVWCAAGKGTFGTEELVSRLQTVGLADVVSHRTIILPQLGAPGVSGFLVTKQSGFKVVYGPVRASDIKNFLDAGMKATDAMRVVRFTLRDRIVLTPIEFVGGLKTLLFIFGILFVLTATGFGHYGLIDLYAFLGAVVGGTVLAPVLLPWIPGRAFSFKGFFLGFLWAVGVALINGIPVGSLSGWLKVAACFMLLPALSAFYAMNFTGSSTYTSLSGVDKEMRIALPIMIISSGIGVILLLTGDLIQRFI